MTIAMETHMSHWVSLERHQALEAELAALRRENDLLKYCIGPAYVELGDPDLIMSEPVKNALLESRKKNQKLESELAALRKQIADAPEVELRRVTHSIEFRLGGNIEMQPGETRTFRLLEVKNGND